MIDKWDIAILERWLKLARTKGTTAIKIVVGDRPNEWTIKEIVDGAEVGAPCVQTKK